MFRPVEKYEKYEYVHRGKEKSEIGKTFDNNRHRANGFTGI